MKNLRKELLGFIDHLHKNKIIDNDLATVMNYETEKYPCNSSPDVQKEPCKNCEGKGYGWVEDLKQFLPCECTFRQGG